MRSLLAAPALVFALVAAGPTSARYSEPLPTELRLRSIPAPDGAWGGQPIGRQPWMGYPYRN